jgi:Spy/CpxP family protein refolding chaperone
MVRPIRIVAVIVALIALLAGGAALYAQAQGTGGPRGAGRGFGPGGPGAAGLPLRALKLTDAQQQQVRQIMEQYRPQFQALNERVASDIRAILTPEQLQQADKLKADRDARAQQRRQKRSQQPTK